LSELLTPGEVVLDGDDIGVSPREESAGSHPDRLLRQWQRGLHISHIAHSRDAVSYDGRARGRGVPTIVISTAVGTSLFTRIAASAESCRICRQSVAADVSFSPSSRSMSSSIRRMASLPRMRRSRRSVTELLAASGDHRWVLAVLAVLPPPARYLLTDAL
jgi:hypothetical protein